MTQTLLSALTKALQAELQNRFGDQFAGLIQFGSTVELPLKRETDLDLFAILDRPLDRAARRDLSIEVESAPAVQTAVRMLRDAGYQIQPSLLLRSLTEAAHFSPLYLDWPERSLILHDPRGMLQALVEKTRKYIESSGARKVRKGLLWYWDLGQGRTANETFPIGWK